MVSIFISFYLASLVRMFVCLVKFGLLPVMIFLLAFYSECDKTHCVSYVHLLKPSVFDFGLPMHSGA